ncbi:MAG: flippase-like domain-containing protein [Chloroflexota bacterium]|nr:flippase-like domain-containing protein [Chloroflexota bacterium]PLS81394.1 MAG: TIGR00374 family protein [Chloroflexota bacterium]
MVSFGSLQRKIALSAVLGALVIAVLSLLTDVRAVGNSLASFRWTALGAVLGWTVFNYVLRWLKWDYYLRRLGMGQGVSYLDSALLFVSGMVMAVTPGKVGEVFKSYLLKRVNGTAISASAPIVLAERLTDGLGMLLLMAVGLNLYPPARPLFWLLLAVGGLGIAGLQYRPLALWLLDRVERTRGIKRFGPAARSFYESSFALFSWRLLLVSTLLSIVSWGGECVAFYYVLTGLGSEPSLHLLLVATFVFAASTLFGLVSFLPGGIGTSEASSVALLMALIGGITSGMATAATIMIRFCTLWFGVSLGVVALLIFERRYRGTEDEPRELRVANESQ